MYYETKNYTVESVTSGHPDKVCDQISDAVLDECLRQDPMSRVAVEVFGGHGAVIIGGEVTTNADVDFEKIARDVYKEIGYDQELEIIQRIVKQSSDIAQGVDTGGAGDQGIMYGYATSETPEFMPEAVVRVHDLARGLEKLRKNKPEFYWLRPDGKTQITVENGKITTVLVSCQHDEFVENEFIKKMLMKHLIGPIIGDSSNVQILVNPTGKFVQGGFEADTGLTGRKIMVDTYCGLAPHGGGAFSGKDATKVDRSAAYMARYAAKNIVAWGLAKECIVSVAYAIGKADPLMIQSVNEKGADLSQVVRDSFNFKPQSIIKELELRKPIYKNTAVYGHFGKEDFAWEKVVERRGKYN
jgi:S-adenosylmethionine synthetase